MTDPREVVVYLPGLDGTGRLLFQQPALLDRFDVRPASYPQDREATLEELAGLVPTLASGSPCTVLAESFGSLVALKAALDHPSVIRRMVLVNPFARRPRFLSRLIPLLSPRSSRPAPAWSRPLRGAYFFHSSLPSDVRAAWWDLTSDVPLTAQLRRLRLANSANLMPHLPCINTPTLVVVSTNDRVVPPARGRELARCLPHSRLLEIRAGHAALAHPSVNAANWIVDPQVWPESPSLRR